MTFRPKTSRNYKGKGIHDRKIVLSRRINPIDNVYNWKRRHQISNQNELRYSIASNRIGMMLKALNKASPGVDEEIISPEEAQELIEKARKKLIDLKADELKALKNIAQQSPHYKFEDVSLMPNENKKLDRALDANEIDLEQLKIDNPELYRDIKNSLPAWMQHPDKMPKSIKGSDLSPMLAQKLLKNGLLQLDPDIAELLDRRIEEEQQAYIRKDKHREQLDDAVSQLFQVLQDNAGA